MKRILAILLTAVLVFALAACGGDETSINDESDGAVSENGESAPDESNPADESDESAPADESDESNPADESDESDPADESEVVDNPSEDENTIPEFISNFVSWSPLNTKIRATDSTSIQLTAVNEDAGYGDVVVYTYDYANDKVVVKNGNYADYAFLIAEYDEAVFSCSKSKLYTVGSLTDNSALTVPDDGFIIAAHKDQTVMVAKLSECPEDVSLFVAGVQVCDVNYSINKTNTVIAIDGKIENAWDAHLIDHIDSSNPNWSYLNFDNNDYYTTADYYVTYDSENIYLAVAVSSPFHYCPISPSDPGGMYQYECIQVKVTTVSPKSDYILENYDHVINNTANTDGKVRAYGFAVNDEGETCYYENSGVSKEFKGSVACTRDDSAQLTVYEISIPWSSLDLDPNEVKAFGLTFSINSTNEGDVQNGTWRNLVLRDGGGVINRNDWAKIPEVTVNP